MIRLAFLLLLLSLPAQAQVRVIDGDTIALDGTTYRLHGIDAPELSQTCGDWIAGEYAAAVLRGILQRRHVVCLPRATDRYGRSVGVCLADGMDVGAAMVSLGMAWAYTRFSNDYLGQELFARRNIIGIHANGCRPAWEWRRKRQ